MVWAFSTLALIVADDSPACVSVSSCTFTAGTSRWISILSSRGPESLLRYRWICAGVQRQSFSEPRKLHGQGFIAETSMKSAGNRSDCEALAMVTWPSSRGCRKTSRTLRLNSGSSSRKSTPLWARETSPGLGICPPPISPASEMVWCGALKGLAVMRLLSLGMRPMVE